MHLNSSDPPIQVPPASPRPNVRVLAKGAGVMLAGSVVGRIVHLVTQVVLARALGPAAFGLYGIGWTVLRMVGVIAPLGLDTGVLRYASIFAKRDSRRFKGAVLASVTISWSSGLVLGVVVFALAPWLANGVFQKPDLGPVLRWLAVAFPFYSGLFAAASATRASQDMRYAVYAQHLIRPAFLLGLFLLLFTAGWELMGAVAATTLAFVVSFGFSLFYLARLYPELYMKTIRPIFQLKTLLAFSLTASLGTAFTSYVGWIDRLMVAYYLPASDVGIYHAASQVSVGFSLIIGAFNTIFGPVAARLYGDRDIAELNLTFKVMTKWALYLSLPVALVLFLSPEAALTLFFGDTYAPGSSPLMILVIGQLANVAAGSVGLLLLMSGHPVRWFATSAIMLIVNFILNIVLIPVLGLNGAAVAASITLVGLYGSGLLQARTVLGVWPYDRRYLKGLLSIAISALVVFGTHFIAIESAALRLAISVVVATSVFFPLIFLLGLDPEDRLLGKLVLNKFRSTLSGVEN